MTGWAPYCGAAPTPEGWSSAWNLDPILLGALALALGGIRTATDRKAFLSAWILLVVLFVSPACALTSALFAARVGHHVLLAGLAAPLLARAFAWRSRHLVPSTAVSIGIFYAWHVPAIYGAALASDVTYWLLTLAMLGSATWFWAAIRAATTPAAVAALLVTMVAMGLLGALLTFAASPLFAPHYATTRVWGLTPLEDQQLAGLIMWAPAAGLYLAAALRLGWRKLSPRNDVAAT